MKNEKTIIDNILYSCGKCGKKSPTLISLKSVTGEDSFCGKCFFITGTLKGIQTGICPVCRHTKPYHDHDCTLQTLALFYTDRELVREVIVHDDLWIENGRLRAAVKSTDGKFAAGMFPDVTHILRAGSRIKIMEEGL